MPDSCCAVGCSNVRGKGERLSFYRIPFGTSQESSRRRLLWVNAIRRKGWTEEMIDNARICSAHFISGEKSNDPSHPDYVPSVFVYNKPKVIDNEIAVPKDKRSQAIKRYERALKRKLYEDDAKVVESDKQGDTVHQSLNEKGVRTDGDDLLEQNHQLLSRNANLLLQLNSNMSNFAAASSNAISGDASKHNLSFASIEHDDQMILFYTGLRNATVFQWFLSLFKDKVFTCCKLSLEDHLLIVLMKLRLGLLNKDLAFRFCVSFQAISKIYRTWIPVMAAEVKFVIVWPNRNIIRKNLPTSFKGKFSDCVVIIDCTEIFIERPFSLNARAQTWSNYKNTNTIKYLLGITPSGSICFLSPGWGGRVSDKEITVQSESL